MELSIFSQFSIHLLTFGCCIRSVQWKETQSSLNLVFWLKGRSFSLVLELFPVCVCLRWVPPGLHSLQTLAQDVAACRCVCTVSLLQWPLLPFWFRYNRLHPLIIKIFYYRYKSVFSTTVWWNPGEWCCSIQGSRAEALWACPHPPPALSSLWMNK